MADLIADQPDAFEGEHLHFTVMKLGNAEHPSWRRTALFTLALQGKQLTVQANSQQRLDSARHWLARVAGERVTFLERTPQPLNLPPLSVSYDAQPLVEGPWMEVLPALDLRSAWLGPGGARLHSPDERTREAARREAHLALAQAERAGFAQGLDVRRAIGLSWRGAWLGGDSLWLGLGGGVPLSLALQTVCAPLLGELEGDQPTTLSDALRLAWAAWAVAGLRVSPDEAVALARQRLQPARKEKKSKGPVLSPELPQRSPNVELLLSSLPWALERTRLLFPLDRREVREVRVTKEPGGLSSRRAGRPTPPSSRRWRSSTTAPASCPVTGTRS